MTSSKPDHFQTTTTPPPFPPKWWRYLCSVPWAIWAFSQTIARAPNSVPNKWPIKWPIKRPFRGRKYIVNMIDSKIWMWTLPNRIYWKICECSLCRIDDSCLLQKWPFHRCLLGLQMRFYEDIWGWFWSHQFKTIFGWIIFNISFNIHECFTVAFLYKFRKDSFNVLEIFTVIQFLETSLLLTFLIFLKFYLHRSFYETSNCSLFPFLELYFTSK